MRTWSIFRIPWIFRIQFTQNSQLCVTLPFQTRGIFRIFFFYLFLRTFYSRRIFRTLIYSKPEEYWEPSQASTINVFFNELWHIYDEVFYSESFVTTTYLDPWHIQNLSIFRTQDIWYRESLKYSLHKTLCNLDIIIFYTLYIQALAYWQPEEYDGPFSMEHCVTLAYSELESYSEPSQISIMKNFIQNHV